MPNVDVTRVAGNIGALNALHSLQTINNQLAIHQTRLATGKRLNQSADDPAGMSIATSFDVRRQGMQVVLNSIGDAKNLMATAEGGLGKIQDILVKMRNKALEAVGDTLGATGSDERNAVRDQLQAYADEIDDIVGQTQWNGRNLIGVGGSAGGATAAMSFVTDVSGGTTSYALTQGFGSVGTGTTGLGLKTSATAYATGLSVNSSTDAKSAVTLLEASLKTVKSGIAAVGTLGARLGFKEEAITVQYTNTEAAYNRIMNANMAEEQVNASKYLILQQTSTAMLSQANSAPQFLLSLFR